ncbi:MAG: site-specific DNA-methyltransferase [Betaproteobacteria bacterium]|nr:MAG: site-specific DNA-methyltransferase [Betaproteobacteria bacterium]
MGMARLPDGCVDMVLCDLPYGTTQCKWDAVIPFKPLWAAYERVIKATGAIVLTAAQPFTSALVMSNPCLFRYSWVWEKSKAMGYLNAKKRPLVAHEDVLIFSKKPVAYCPQMTDGEPYNKGKALRPIAVYGPQRAVLVKNKDGKRYPRTVQYFKTAESEGQVAHPTQKPVGLFEYLVKTYTNPGGIVLDNCMGSGTTAVACISTGRRFIGFEKDKQYYDNAISRIAEMTPGMSCVGEMSQLGIAPGRRLAERPASPSCLRRNRSRRL